MIHKLLIANRGEIARRIIRTAHGMGIPTVAVFSDADHKAPHVREAEESVRLAGTAASDTYLDIPKIIEAAKATGADSVHPGYGFLAENAEFAKAVRAAGLIFVGPSVDAIAVMGSKLESKKLMQDIGVPTLASTDVTGLSDSETTAAARTIGYPVLVKASAGGGGKGMRIVTEPAALIEAVRGAEREAEAAFGDKTVFLEKYLESPRHIEVQVFGDHFGNHVHLFERECSIQRRHQKIIEESPSPAVDIDLRKRMGAAALAAASAVDYVGAGTVEFLLGEDDDFYFLEMNTRLQVEHPVTEMVTGIDLVRLQLLIADREPMSDSVLMAAMHGHAIEARLYAEDTRAGFLPQTGTLHRFAIPDGVRVDSGVEDGSEVSIHYDPMLAKVIAHAPTRNEAARALALALDHAHIHGVTTNRRLLVEILRHPEFLAGDTDTHFLERHPPAELDDPLPDPVLGRHALAAALARQAINRSETQVLAQVPSGWRNSPSQLQEVSFEIEDREIAVGYRFSRGNTFEATVDGQVLEQVAVPRVSSDWVTIESAGVARAYTVAQVGDRYFVDGPDGASECRELPRFGIEEVEDAAGSLVSPMPGQVVSVSVEEGDEAQAGDVLVIVEAMKMEHSVRATFDGTVSSVHVAAGDQVENDQVLVVVRHADEDNADGTS